MTAVEVMRPEPAPADARYVAWSTPSGMLAEVRDTRTGKRVGRRFRGETAWSDAARSAADRSAAPGD